MLRHHDRRIVRPTLTTLFTLFAMWCVVGSASATVFVRVADTDLAATSDQVVVGVVRGVEDAAGVDRPITTYEIDVEQQVLGASADPVTSLTVQTLGGVLGEHELRIEGGPRLVEGERVLLFLHRRDDGRWAIRFFVQGLFRIATIDGRDIAFRTFDGATELPLPGRQFLHPEQPRDLDRFIAWMRDQATASPRPADYFVDVSEAALRDATKFTLIRSGGLGIRWREFDTGGSVTFRSFNGNQPGLPSGGHSEFQTALRVWTNDPATPIRLRYGGRTGATGGLRNFDGVNAILWDDPNGEFDEPFSCTMGGVIAIGGPWFNRNNRHMFNGDTYITTLGGDVVTNANLACWIGSFRRAEEVFAHEIGHTLGLGHSCGDPASGPCNTAVKDDALMRAFAHGDNRGARLGQDDRDAIAFLYGVSVTPPEAPSGLSANAADLEEVRLGWTDNSTNEAAFRIERSVGGGNFAEIGSVGANVRSFTDNSASSGTGVRYRVRATNGAGSSDYSNTANTTTLGEPSPSGLTAVALNATQVRLNWVDNGVSETGFQIEADGFGIFVPVATASANATEVIVDDLNPNTQYQFRMRSTGGPAGRSTFTDAVVATTLDGVPNPCVAADDRLCLNRDRFRVQVFFTDPDGSVGVATSAAAGTADSGLLWFFDENNLEVLIKVLDACGINQHFWMLSAATTNLGYTLVVTDTETGTTAVYLNEAGDPAPAVVDVGALPVCPGSATTPGSAPPAVRTPEAIGEASRELSATLKASIGDHQRTAIKEGCDSGSDILCLTGDRFQVEVDFRSQDALGRGQAVPVAADSGLFWFFESDNWEMLVKVLDACGINQRFWVFSAATTDVEYTLKVTDRMTGAVREYSNPLGTLAPAVVDADAFDSCP